MSKIKKVILGPSISEEDDLLMLYQPDYYDVPFDDEELSSESRPVQQGTGIKQYALAKLEQNPECALPLIFS